MPLFLCPNDNAAMQTVKRGDVELDICPQCRGVWLDRGELEKLLGEVKAERQAFDHDVDDFRRDPEEWRQRHPYDAQQQRYKPHDSDHYYKHKKKRGFDLFDIFD